MKSAHLSEHVERIVAFVSSIFISILMIGCILRNLPKILSSSLQPDFVIQVVFLPSKVNSGAITASVRLVSAKSDGKVFSKKKSRLGDMPAMSQHIKAASLHVYPFAASDKWGQTAEVFPGSEDLRNFKPNLIDRPASSMSAAVDRMHLTFYDRSLGGQLKRMSQRAACLELKQALASNPISANAILASMDDYGCHKR